MTPSGFMRIYYTKNLMLGRSGHEIFISKKKFSFKIYQVIEEKHSQQAKNHYQPKMSLSKGGFSADHSENRICVACGKKCKGSIITELSSGQIKTYLDPHFELSDEHYPVILCVSIAKSF